jgi:hypothetical protein
LTPGDRNLTTRSNGHPRGYFGEFLFVARHFNLDAGL